MNLLLRYLKPHWKLILVTLLLAAINQIFSLLDPWIFRLVIDNYATHFQDFDKATFFRGVAWLLLAAIGVAFVSRVAKNFQDYYVNVITQKVGLSIYTTGIQHSLELPYEVFEDQRSGQTLGLLQKVRSDTEKLIGAFVNTLFTTLVGFIFVMVYAINVHWLIAPVYFITGPLIGGLSLALSKRIKRVQQDIVRETTALAGATTESLRNIELVKSLGLAEQEIGRLNSTSTKILALELKKVRYVRSLSFVQGTCINFIRTSIMFLMLYLIYTREITFGEFFSLYIYSFFIFGPLQELGNIIGIYREAEISLGHFSRLLDMPRELRPSSPLAITRINRLEFSNVEFQYNSGSRPALQGISFQAHSGSTIAFVGPSGSGKTTLVKLLVGLYRPGSGKILFNDTAHDDIDFEKLRSQVGLVPQEAQLFAGTIRENLLFVRPEASDTECLTVLKKAACDPLLERASDGLSTVIGEGGVKLSGGEKQRLSIARALLREPSVLVFDEATSALDSLTEEEVSKTIRLVSKEQQRITILIAHRLSTIMHADHIYVLEQGHIVESGCHDELLAEKGLYYAMWRQQIGERHLPAAA